MNSKIILVGLSFDSEENHLTEGILLARWLATQMAYKDNNNRAQTQSRYSWHQILHCFAKVSQKARMYCLKSGR